MESRIYHKHYPTRWAAIRAVRIAAPLVGSAMDQLSADLLRSGDAIPTDTPGEQAVDVEQLCLWG
jgi:hypothetical protein